MANSIIWKEQIIASREKEQKEKTPKDGEGKEEAKVKELKKRTIHIGDTIKVHYRLLEKVEEAGKTKRSVIKKIRERTQIFEGILIAIRGKGDDASFTVRRVGAGSIGIERVFPLISPWIRNITVSEHGRARRAKLYYLRGRTGKAATYVKEKKNDLPEKKPVRSHTTKKPSRSSKKRIREKG